MPLAQLPPSVTDPIIQDVLARWGIGGLFVLLVIIGAYRIFFDEKSIVVKEISANIDARKEKTKRADVSTDVLKLQAEADSADARAALTVAELAAQFATENAKMRKRLRYVSKVANQAKADSAEAITRADKFENLYKDQVVIINDRNDTIANHLITISERNQIIVTLTLERDTWRARAQTAELQVEGYRLQLEIKKHDTGPLKELPTEPPIPADKTTTEPKEGKDSSP